MAISGNLLIHVCADVEYPSSADESKKAPAILVHKQAMSQDGTFNVAFAGDNGIQQGETIHPDGTRIGAYSYVDPNGEPILLEYRADKDGFKIMRADHVPKAVIASASYNSPQSTSGTKYPSSFDGASSDEHSDDSGLGPIASYSHYRGEVNTIRPVGYLVYDETNANYAQAAPSYAALRNRKASVNNGYRIANPNKPHLFGNGYSFEFGTATNES